MNIKKQVINEIIANLESEKNLLEHKIYQNKYKHKQYINEQTKLKRKRAELGKLINNIKMS